MAATRPKLSPLLLAIAALSFMQTSTARCPERCSCLYDNVGRKTVSCDAGKLGASIPIFDMERDTKVLVISSADEEPAMLTVGPIFSPLPQLEEVHITRANLPVIGENSFWGLKHLRLLNLTENDITLVLESHLRGIRGLQHLHLDDNKISTIPSATFMSLENLLTLTISKNKLRGLTPRMFYLLTNLRTLDISNNAIMDLDPEVLRDLPSLTTLRCAKCELGRVRSLLYKVLPQLETLDLKDNYIVSLAPEEFMDLPYLKYLYLDGNKIRELKDYTFKNKGLQHLGLSNNHLEKIARLAFDGCSIMSIDLSYNKISHSSLRHLNPIIRHVHKLSLADNKLSVEYIRDLLKRAPRLKNLNLSHMHIHQLQKDIFTSQAKLELLNLSGNFLRFIQVDILHSLQSLVELDLRKNEIRGLPEIILRRLDKVRNIHLEDNPWSCDQCHIPQLKVWLNNSKAFRNACKPDIDAPKCLRCQAPVEMFDKPIIEIDGLELQPCPEGTFDVAAASAGASEFSLLLAVVTSTVVLVLLTIILIVGIIMYNRHSAFYYTHENDARRHFYDNPVIHSNHTDITMDEDMDQIPEDESFYSEPSSRDREHVQRHLPSKEGDFNHQYSCSLQSPRNSGEPSSSNHSIHSQIPPQEPTVDRREGKHLSKPVPKKHKL